MSPKLKQSIEEHLKKKREAERARYEQIRNDPVKWEAQKEKERQKYLKKKEKGQRKLIADMTPRERRTTRKNWKHYSSEHRSRQKLLDYTSNFMQKATPPDSDNEDQQITPNQRNSRRILAAKKRSNRIKRKRNQELKKKEEEIKKYKRRARNCKAKYYRLKKRISFEKKSPQNTLSPKTKILEIAKDPTKKEELEKRALFGEALESQLCENYGKMKTHKEKRAFNKIISGNIVKKYKLWRISKKNVLSYKRMNNSPKKISFTTKSALFAQKLAEKIQAFFEDDENSRLCAGKKEFVVRRGIKKQRRFLSDSIRSLHKKFLQSTRISYSLFCRLRPFWVIAPKVSDRDTCLCATHSHMDFLILALKNSKILPFNTSQALLRQLCCDKYDEECLERSCKTCCQNNLCYKEFDNSVNIKFIQWISSKVEYIDPKTKKFKFTNKCRQQVFELQPRELILKLETSTLNFFNHERNIVHQYQAFKQLTDSLSESDAIIHMDFSENYATKYAAEIQSFHFGGSRTQLSLHTAVVYLKEKISSFCTVSADLSHGPRSIFAHLMPIFKSLPEKVENIHFFSDGPVTQYRNKFIFYMLACELVNFYPNLSRYTWNHEAGHGEGAPDGIGAVCKRTADSIIATGGNVTTLEEFTGGIQERCPGVQIFTIKSEEIESMSKILKENVSETQGFPGTLKVHQVTGNIFLPRKNTMKSLSCFCDPNGCDHYNLGVISYKKKILVVSNIFSDSEEEEKIENKIEVRVKDSDQGYASTSCESYKIGDYLLIKFKKFRSKTESRYVGICLDVDETEEELRMMFFKHMENGTTFKLDEKDVADVKFDQALEKLPAPNTYSERETDIYKFPSEINVYEK